MNKYTIEPHVGYYQFSKHNKNCQNILLSQEGYDAFKKSCDEGFLAGTVILFSEETKNTMEI